MHLRVDNARKDVKTAAVDPLACRGAGQSADLDDAPVAHPNVAEANPIMIDQCPVDQNAIETRRHG